MPHRRQAVLEEIVANHKSAVKRHKQSVKRAARNRTVKTRIKNVVKSVHQER